MDKFLKLKDGKKLAVKFSPRGMARFQRETKFTMGYFIQAVEKMMPLAGFKTTGNLAEDVHTVGTGMNIIGFEELRLMMFAGCPEIESLDQADELLDELEEGLFQNISVLIMAFTDFLNGNLQAGEVETESEDEKGNPTQPKNSKKPGKEAVKPAG